MSPGLGASSAHDTGTYWFGQLPVYRGSTLLYAPNCSIRVISLETRLPAFVILGGSLRTLRIEPPYGNPIVILIAVNAMVSAEHTTSTHPMARSALLWATRSWPRPSPITPRLKTIAPIPPFPDTN